MKYLFVGCVFMLLVSCSSQSEIEYLPSTAAFNEAMTELDDQRNVLALQSLNKFLAQYPWDKRAEHTRLELIRLHIEAAEFDKALAQIKEVEELYQTIEQPDYLLFAKGYAYYLQNKMTIEDYVYTDISLRAIDSAQLAFDTFNQLLLMYPNSQYAPNARQRMVYLRNLFAAKEIDIARFYLKQKAYLACTNRAIAVLTTYISTPSVVDGVALLKQCAAAAHIDELVFEADILAQQLSK